MKLFIFLLFTAFGLNSYAQESISDLIFKNKAKIRSAVQVKNDLDLAGLQLQKSAKYQYGALGLATISAGLFVGSAFLENDYSYNKGEIIKEKNNTKTALLIGGGVCAVASILCELYAIDLRMKAGKSIRLYANGTGGGLTLNF